MSSLSAQLKQAASRKKKSTFTPNIGASARQRQRTTKQSTSEEKPANQEEKPPESPKKRKIPPPLAIKKRRTESQLEQIQVTQIIQQEIMNEMLPSTDDGLIDDNDVIYGEEEHEGQHVEQVIPVTQPFIAPPIIAPAPSETSKKEKKKQKKQKKGKVKEKVTIRDYIKDTRAGKPTKATAQRLEAARRARERRKLEKQRKQMPRMIQPLIEEPEEEVIAARVTPQPERQEPVDEEVAEDQEEEAAPQVQLVDGRIVINQDSIVIQQPEVNLDQYERVTEDKAKRITSATYSRFKRADKWKEEETERFFNALRQFGSDFSMIARLFPTRTRREIRNKFKREERENKAKVDWCLKNRLPIDIEQFKKYSQKKDRLEGVVRKKKKRTEKPTEKDTEVKGSEEEEVSESPSESHEKGEEEWEKEKQLEVVDEGEWIDTDLIRGKKSSGEHDLETILQQMTEEHIEEEEV